MDDELKRHTDNFLLALREGHINGMLDPLRLIDENSKISNIKIKMPFDIKKTTKFFKMLKGQGQSKAKLSSKNNYFPKRFDPKDIDIYIAIFSWLKSKSISML